MFSGTRPARVLPSLARDYQLGITNSGLPRFEDGEYRDKGYINQAVALGRRADLVKKLYADPAGNDIVVA